MIQLYFFRYSFKFSHNATSLSEQENRICNNINNVTSLPVSRSLPYAQYSARNATECPDVKSYLRSPESLSFKRELVALMKHIMKTGNMDISLLGSAADFYIKTRSPNIGDLDFFCIRKNCVGKFVNGFNSNKSEHGGARVGKLFHLTLDEDRFVECRNEDRFKSTLRDTISTYY